MNKCFISGRLVADPVIRYLTSGTAVLNFIVASDETYFKEGKKVEAAEYHALVAFDKLAVTIGTYFKKGHGIVIEGHLKTRKYPHKEHPVDMYKTEIHVDKFEFSIAAPKSENSTNDGMSNTQEQDASYDRGGPPAFNH